MNARGHLSSETIDLMMLEALKGDEANQAKVHLDGCDFCRTRWQELNEDKRHFEQFVFARTLPRVEARVQPRGFFARFNLKLLVPAAGLLAAGLVAFVSLEGGDGTQTEDDIYVGVKGGGPMLAVFAQRDARVFEVKPGAKLKAGDRIRFKVAAAGLPYVLVASRDGKGAFTVYAPWGAMESIKLEPQAPGNVELPGAVELDDTLGTEQLVAVFSSSPVKATEVEKALEKNPKAPQLSGARVVSWEFVKEAK
jgi:hypothetical protein